MTIATTGIGADAIPGALGAIERGVERGLHLGAQVYVSLRGRRRWPTSAPARRAPACP